VLPRAEPGSPFRHVFGTYSAQMAGRMLVSAGHDRTHKQGHWPGCAWASGALFLMVSKLARMVPPGRFVQHL